MFLSFHSQQQSIRTMMSLKHCASAILWATMMTMWIVRLTTSLEDQVIPPQTAEEWDSLSRTVADLSWHWLWIQIAIVGLSMMPRVYVFAIFLSWALICTIAIVFSM